MCRFVDFFSHTKEVPSVLSSQITRLQQSSSAGSTAAPPLARAGAAGHTLGEAQQNRAHEELDSLR